MLEGAKGKRSFDVPWIVSSSGFAMLLLVDLLALWGGLPLNEIGQLNINDTLTYWAMPHIATMAFVFLTAGYASSKLTDNPKRRFIVLSGLTMSFGATLLVLQAMTGITSPWMMALAAMFAALGSSSLLVTWELVFVAFPNEKIISTVLVALLLSSAAYLLIVIMPPLARVLVYLVLTCAAALATLHACTTVSKQRCKQQKTSHSDSKGTTSQTHSPLFNIVHLIRDPLFCVAAIMFTIAITRVVALNNVADFRIVNIAGCVSTLVGVVTFYLVRRISGNSLGAFKDFNLLRFFRVIFPALATALLLLPLFGGSFFPLVSSVAFMGYTMSFALILPTCISIARQDGTSPLAVFGVFMGGVNTVFLFATAISLMLYGSNFFGTTTLTIGILLALYVLSMTYSFAMNDRRRRENNAADISARPLDSIGSSTKNTCQNIAKEHFLTKREQEILLLLAHGRDVPSIAKQLFISENTVRTHTKSMYVKLNVHSKQELLDCVDANRLS